MNAFQLIPRFVFSFLAALLGAALSLVVPVNVFVLSAAASCASIVVLLRVTLGPLPRLHRYDREALEIVVMVYFAMAFCAWLLVAMIVLKVKMDRMMAQNQ